MEEKRIEQLKEEYDAIPVPEELESRVREGIREGKEQRAARPKGHLWRNCGLSVAAAAALLVVSVNASPTVAQALERIPVLGSITRVLTLWTYEDARGNVSAHVDVPAVEGGGAELEQSIKAYTDQIIAQYQQDAQAALEAAPDAESAHYDLDLHYTVVTDNDSVFALRFDKTLVMASGVEEVKIYNVDKATGKIMRLGDLFQPDSAYLETLTQLIQEQMRDQMAADENVVYWLDSEVLEWDFTQLSADAAFYLNADGELVIVFNEGDVAPMYMGVVEFAIPAQSLADIALPGYLG